MRFRHEIGYLIEAAGDEINELHFRYGPQPEETHSACRADDGRFADGRFNHALAAEFRQKSFGSFERPAVYADVFANRDDRRIAVHFLEHGLANSLNHGDGSHVSVSRVCRVGFDSRAGREDFAILALTCPWGRGQTERAELLELPARSDATAVSAEELCRRTSLWA